MKQTIGASLSTVLLTSMLAQSAIKHEGYDIAPQKLRIMTQYVVAAPHDDVHRTSDAIGYAHHDWGRAAITTHAWWR